jgi:hypothetical protein
MVCLPDTTVHQGSRYRVDGELAFKLVRLDMKLTSLAITGNWYPR